MKQIIKGLILVGLLLQANFLVAEIFRNQDADGSVSFSDVRSNNATVVAPVVRSYRYKHVVAKIYDGDTIVLKNGERVRLLGINTPEIESRHRQGETGGILAKEWLQDKLQQGQVFVEYDQQQRDKYKRLLAHLFLASGEHLNESIIRSGLATLTIMPPNLRYSDVLTKAEIDAQQHGRGIWSMADYQPLSISALSKEKRQSGWHRFLATPTQIKYSRKYVRLILNTNVDIRIPKDNLDLFPELTEYLGQSLEIRGWASRTKSHFSILVRHPSAIIFL